MTARLILFTYMTFVLSACGGNGSDEPSRPPPPPTPVNLPPSVSIQDIPDSTEGLEITVSAEESDSDGSVDSIQWRQTNGPDVEEVKTICL